MNIELRSDEVQELMGRVPPYIQRVGISVILLIVIGFFVASAFIKYPTYIPVKARMLPNEYLKLYCVRKMERLSGQRNIR